MAQRGGTEHGTDIVNTMGDWSENDIDFSNGDRNTIRQQEIVGEVEEVPSQWLRLTADIAH